MKISVSLLFIITGVILLNGCNFLNQYFDPDLTQRAPATQNVEREKFVYPSELGDTLAAPDKTHILQSAGTTVIKILELNESDPAINGDHLYMTMYTTPESDVPKYEYDLNLNVYSVSSVSLGGVTVSIVATEEYFPDESDKEFPKKRTTNYLFMFDPETGKLLRLINKEDAE